jgi:PKD repeat protein
MKRACLLLLPAVLMLVLAVSGCNDESKPTFTRVRVKPACGVVPMVVEGYAIASGGNESGDPLGGNNNLEIAWQFGDGGTGKTSIAYHTYRTPGEYTVSVSATDPDGQTAASSVPVVVLQDSLEIRADYAGSENAVTVADTVRFNIEIVTCDIDFPEIPGDSVKVQFDWAMGDAADTHYSVPSPAFQYTAAGDYQMIVSVFYPEWAVVRRDTLNISVAP